MAHVHSKKRIRDAALLAQLAARGDEPLTRLGLTRDDLMAMLPKFRGTIVFPDDPNYNTDRRLFNPVFDPYPMMIIYCVVNSDVQLALMLAKVTSSSCQTDSPH